MHQRGTKKERDQGLVRGHQEYKRGPPYLIKQGWSLPTAKVTGVHGEKKRKKKKADKPEPSQGDGIPQLRRFY